MNMILTVSNYAFVTHSYRDIYKSILAFSKLQIIKVSLLEIGFCPNMLRHFKDLDHS